MTPKGKRRLTRRRFLKAAAGAVVGATVATALDALAIEPRWIKVTRPSVAIAGLPPAWDGARIAHITDLHLGRLIDLDLVRKAVALANVASPDVIVLTGDYVSRRDVDMDALARALSQLNAPLGAFAVLGNHDHWCGAARVRKMLLAAGLRIIDNSHAAVVRASEPLVIAGVGDLWEDDQYLTAALAGAPKGAPVVLLCHNPDYADHMPPTPRVDLMLCGHTHGGQVKIPLGRRPRLPIRNPRYAAGLVAGPHCRLYISRGIGMVGVPARFNCRPELPIIALRRRQTPG